MSADVSHHHRAQRGLLTLLVGVLALACAGSVAARPDYYGPPACQTVTFHSDPGLDAQRVCMNLGVRSHAGAPGEYLFLTPHSSGAGIFKTNGSLVWWDPLPAGAVRAENLSVVTLWGHPYLAVWSGEGTSTGSLGKIRLYDEHYRQVGVITAGGKFQPGDVDLHEFRVTPQNDALIGIWETVPRIIAGRSQQIIQYVVQKLSLIRGATGIQTGRLLFQWDSLQHIPATESHQPRPAQGVWDYFHGNSVTQDSDGNLLISGRNTWGIYKVSSRTGNVIWQVGGKGAPALARPWCDQHDITALGNGRYSLFDDGGTGAGCEPGGAGHASRALIFRVTTTGGRPTLTLLHAYTHHPRTSSGVFGSVQALPNGNVLVDWGSTPEVTEYNSAGDRVALDLSLSNQSYRAFQFPWVGLPAAPPSVAAAPRKSGMEVWASWNGSTQVTAWRVLAGPVASQLTPVSTSVRKSGFETSVYLRHVYPYVAVQALEGHRTLATSATIQPPGG